MFNDQMKVTSSVSGLSILPVSNAMTENRIGVFTVNRKLFRHSDWASLVKFFSSFVIVRAEVLYMPDSIEYMAFSPLFDQQYDDCIVPRYRIETNRKGDEFTCRAIKLDTKLA